ncbi:urea carboxylase [Microdochium trichocladiopsis]|uniref:Urea carboxylase n=1 Tax=Microdochium trichocladiopsis TaxID=1682393 RepID=A0A9P8XYV0_9PEZI|nr:urea carboxylase [Microdochium trichocladiopsis]KAH7025652.1 urea carboxylase [Microdochium trichocladiopsis]
MAQPSPMALANRGEIAIRLIKACQKLQIIAIAIYVADDADSMHVRVADEAYELSGRGSHGYLDAAEIVSLCKAHQIQAVIPGYGFLSEDSRFAIALQAENIFFVGPDVSSLEQFGLKHTARELAIRAGVPVVPGTGTVKTAEEAQEAALRLGYPVMVKATAGGGGMGLQKCNDAEELEAAFEAVRSRGKALFKNAELFLEKYVANGRHVQAQIFGNGQGDVLFFGERECSVQRRHQKIIEESPSPFIAAHPEKRAELQEYSTRLAASVHYKSAGTVEFLVDDDTGDMYFLEVNTRLQVEHGVSELCYGVDLVEMMLLQTAAEMAGLGGLVGDALSRYRRTQGIGHAIEVRVYAENPAKDYAPSPGLLQQVSFPSDGGMRVRVDTWVDSGTVVSPSFDSLIAKIMVHADDRAAAIRSMNEALANTVLRGPPTNFDFLAAILSTHDFVSGHTTTNMLETRFQYQPAAMEFLEPGAFTTVQDYPGRVNVPHGVPQSGPMDSLSFRVANLLVGNPEGLEAFEITMVGPRIKFYSAAVIALCGTAFPLWIEGQQAGSWARHSIPAGAGVQIGEAASGARAYLTVRGGLPEVATYLGSKSTTPSVGWGGYQGRCMRAGDFVFLDRAASMEASTIGHFQLPQAMITEPRANPRLYALPGPWCSDDFTCSFNSNRGGIRLDGPSPAWSRSGGGEGGSHASNMVGYGVALGSVSWTGDAAVVLLADGPNQTGFIITHTIAQCDHWRLSQLRPGEKVSFQAITPDQAMELEARIDRHLQNVARVIGNEGVFPPPPSVPLCYDLPAVAAGDGVLSHTKNHGDNSNNVAFSVRQAGERAILGVFGSGTFNLNLRARVQQMANIITNTRPRGIGLAPIAENFSILVHFDPKIMSQQETVSLILSFNDQLDPVETAGIPSRIIRLPAVFDPPECHVAIDKYMLLQRPYATYLPDNIDFIRRSNGLARRADVKAAFFDTPHVVNAVGWLMGLPIYNVLDPRRQLNVPKYNPARTWTAAGSLGSGGTSSSIYPNDGPGGYMLWGATLPGCCWDTYGRRKGGKAQKPWLFEPFYQIIFHEVDRDVFDQAVRDFRAGRYEIQISEAKLDMAAYNDMLVRTADEVAALRKVQEECTQIELAKEKELLAKWTEEKRLKEGDVSCQQQPGKPQIGAGQLGINPQLVASVWKIQVNVGDHVAAGDTVAVLEAMKMETAVRVPTGGEKYCVAAVLKSPGDTIEVGEYIVVLDKI